MFKKINKEKRKVWGFFILNITRKLQKNFMICYQRGTGKPGEALNSTCLINVKVTFDLHW